MQRGAHGLLWQVLSEGEQLEMARCSSPEKWIKESWCILGLTALPKGVCAGTGREHYCQVKTINLENRCGMIPPTKHCC